ncbi:hypothetical protein SNF32_13745 [Enterococcus mundtii]|nr:hypothetical protein [Enterococcus mundtii]
MVVESMADCHVTIRYVMGGFHITIYSYDYFWATVCECCSWFCHCQFFGSKAIIYAKKKIPQAFNKLVQKFPRVFGPIARGLSKVREKLTFGKQKQPAEQMKDATPVNEKLVEGIEKSEVTKERLASKDLKGKVVAMEAPTKEGANIAEIEEKQSRAKRAWETVRHAPKRMFDYVMKINYPYLSCWLYHWL